MPKIMQPIPSTALFGHLADLTIVMACNATLDEHDPVPIHYTVQWRDLPTGKEHTISANGEKDALYLIAAWIICDEEDIGVLAPYRERLYHDLPKDFLP